MTQKKTIQIVGDDIFPQALIIGDNTLVQMLLEGNISRQKTKNCICLGLEEGSDRRRK